MQHIELPVSRNFSKKKKNNASDCVLHKILLFHNKNEGNLCQKETF